MDTNDIKEQEHISEPDRSHYGHSRADKGRSSRLPVLIIAALIVAAAAVIVGVRSYRGAKQAEAESIEASLAAEAEAQADTGSYELAEFTECMVPELSLIHI